MSQTLTLARPYARAAFAVARDEGALAAWSGALAESARIAADPQVMRLLLSPALSRAQAVDLVVPEGVAGHYRRFLDILAQAGRMALLPEIAALYEALRAEAEHVVHAKVTSAAALSQEELDRLVAALKRRLGREIKVDTAVDPSLIGGAVIDAGDTVIDGSVKGKLARLEAALKQ